VIGMTSAQIREIVKAVCDSRDQREHILEKYVEAKELYDFGFDAGIELALKLTEILGSMLTPANVKDAKEAFMPSNVVPGTFVKYEAGDIPGTFISSTGPIATKVEYVNAPQKVEFDADKSNGFIEKPEDELWSAFQVYLKQNYADEYYKQAIEEFGENLDEIKTWPPSTWIKQPFSWSNTKQGDEYWLKIENKWTEMLIEIESKKCNWWTVFTIFLEENCSNSLYFSNLMCIGKHTLEEAKKWLPEEYLNNAFSWHESPEKVSYWSKLNDGWLKKLEELRND